MLPLKEQCTLSRMSFLTLRFLIAGIAVGNLAELVLGKTAVTPPLRNSPRVKGSLHPPPSRLPSCPDGHWTILSSDINVTTQI